MAEEQQTYLTPEEQLSSLSDTLISSIIRKDDVSKENRRFLFGQVTNKIFKNENYMPSGIPLRIHSVVSPKHTHL